MILAIMLVSCGSDNDGKIDPEKNIVLEPVLQNDQVEVIDGQTVEVDVLSNDSFSSGNLLITDIVQQPVFGSATITDNKITYVPNTGYAGIDRLTYSVNNGQAIANVDISVFQSVTLSGEVSDESLMGAEVSLKSAEKLFSTKIDQLGHYQLFVLVGQLNEPLLLSAKGLAENEQSEIEYRSSLGQAQAILEMAGESRVLEAEQFDPLNVSLISSAVYLYRLEAELKENSEVSESATAYLEALATEDLMYTVGFMQLLNNHDDYDVIEGETNFSILLPDPSVEYAENEATAYSVRGSIFQYLTDNQLVDGDKPIQVFQIDLANSIDSLLNNAKSLPLFTADKLQNKILLKLDPIKEGWLPLKTTSFLLADGGDGAMSYSHFTPYPATLSEMSWYLNEGQLAMSLIYPSDDFLLFNDWEIELEGKFDSEQLMELKLFVEQYNINQLSKHVTENQTIHLLHETQLSFKVVIDTVKTEEYRFILNGENWEGEPLIYQAPIERQYSTFQHHFDTIWQNTQLVDLTGSWALPLIYDSELYLNHSGFMSAFDLITLSNDRSEGKFSDFQFIAQMIDGELSLVEGDVEFRILPFKASEGILFAQVKYLKAGELISFYFQPIVQFDNSYTQFMDNLVIELPKVYLSGYPVYHADAWEGDSLKLENVFGSSFMSNGEMKYNISKQANYEYFTSQEAHWNMFNNEIIQRVEYNYGEYSFSIDKHWEVLTVDSGGRTWLMENRIYSSESINEDVQPSYYILTPRLNIITQGDLSEYEDTWQNTLDRGGL